MPPTNQGMSPQKVQHIFDVIDRKSGRNLEKMQNDLSKIYMLQARDVSNDKKRQDSEWGTLPANVIGGQQVSGQYPGKEQGVSDMKQMKVKHIRPNNRNASHHKYLSLQPPSVTNAASANPSIFDEAQSHSDM
jgi:hypothetical protein